MSRARPSVYVPSRLPGNERLRFLPSAGTTNGERCRNDSRLTTGTAVIVPDSSPSSSSRITRMQAAIEEYSQPWMPAIRLSRGASAAPCAVKQGCGSPARVTSVRRITPPNSRGPRASEDAVEPPGEQRGGQRGVAQPDRPAVGVLDVEAHAGPALVAHPHDDVPRRRARSGRVAAVPDRAVRNLH